MALPGAGPPALAGADQPLTTPGGRVADGGRRAATRRRSRSSAVRASPFEHRSGSNAVRGATPFGHRRRRRQAAPSPRDPSPISGLAWTVLVAPQPPAFTRDGGVAVGAPLGAAGAAVGARRRTRRSRGGVAVEAPPEAPARRTGHAASSPIRPLACALLVAPQPPPFTRDTDSRWVHRPQLTEPQWEHGDAADGGAVGAPLGADGGAVGEPPGDRGTGGRNAARKAPEAATAARRDARSPCRNGRGSSVRRQPDRCLRRLVDSAPVAVNRGCQSLPRRIASRRRISR